jgi:phosphoribosyl-dephospho-CoA transferase
MLRHRHDLVEISEDGRRWAAKKYLDLYPQSQEALFAVKLITDNHSGVKLPGIIRREEEIVADGAVPIGFSSPYLVDHKRLRVRTFVPLKEIKLVTSPYEVLQSAIHPRTECLKALVAIKDIARKLDLDLGVWGSAGLEIYTGLPYTHRGSDLDLLFKPAATATMFKFAVDAFAIGQRYGCRVDIEVDLPSGYGVNIKEIMSGTALIFGKGLRCVELIPRSTVLAVCK